MISGVQTRVATSTSARHVVLKQPPHALLAADLFRTYLLHDRKLAAPTVGDVISRCMRVEKRLEIRLADCLELGVAHDPHASSQPVQLASRLGITLKARDSVACAIRLYARFLSETQDWLEES